MKDPEKIEFSAFMLFISVIGIFICLLLAAIFNLFGVM